jgi:hypothetical protein
VNGAIPPLTVLFLLRNHGYIRNYASTLAMLAERGHRVLLASRGAERHMAVDTDAYLARLCAAHPSISVMKLPRRGDGWTALAEAGRSLRNYARYLEPRYEHATKLRARAAEHARKRGALRLPSTRPGAWLSHELSGWLEARLPVDAGMRAELEQLAPDVVVATPFVDFNSYQVDWIAAARELGMPTVWCVASWDNLSNKGVAPLVPDRVLVWNETQRREAIEMHAVPASRVVVTGAQLFDDWFTQRPSTSRTEFCRGVGLPDRPFLLYLCSSLFIAPDEISFVRRWLEQVRGSSDAALRDCGVLVRPHPGHAGIWHEADLEALGPVAVWPRAGELPIEDDAKRHYFDSLAHCAAVVGVNTSGMLEAGIAGRRSYTLLAPEFAETQQGTVHFDYLTEYGFLTVARSWPEHLSHLTDAVAGRNPFEGVERARALAFVRPHGADEPSTPRVVDAIEQAAVLRVAPATGRAPGVAARLATWGLSRWLQPARAPWPPGAPAPTRSAAPPRRPLLPQDRRKG